MSAETSIERVKILVVLQNAYDRGRLATSWNPTIWKRELLASRTDAGHPEILLVEFILDEELGVSSFHATEFFGVPEANLPSFNGYIGKLFGSTLHDYHVIARLLHLNREIPPAQSAGYSVGKW